MYRRHRAFLSGLAMMSLAVAVPSNGWAQGGLVVSRPNPVDSLSLWNLGTDRTPSPDGTKYVINASTFGGDPNRGKIFMYNADGTNPVQLTPDDIFVYSPYSAWSPDGTRIAFAGHCVPPYDCHSSAIYREPSSLSSGIWVINADGTNPVFLGPDECYGPCVKNHPHLDLSHDPRPSDLAWSSDGTKIAFTSRRLVPDYYFSDGERYQKSAWDIFVMNADGTNLVRLTNSSKEGERWSFSRFPAYSPDGRWLAFISNHDDFAASPGIYIANPDGTNPVRIGDCGSCYRLAWSPDGRLIYHNYSLSNQRSETYAITLTERGDRRATLLNLSPWQAWVHLYCLKDRAGPDADPPAPCTVTFECNGFSGEPVMWPVEVAPKTIFSYWPNKTATDGTAADLHAALVAAGKTEDEARRRTTCEVFSPDPLTVRGYTLFGGQPTLVPVAEPARPNASAEPGERRRQATLPNLSPWQAWVHLYCLKDRADPDADPPAPCAVTFECNGQSGEPVTWPVTVAPKTIFSYWPNKTVDGMSADLQAALIAAGKPEDEARRRTTCEVSSADPIAVRGYTLFGGQPTLVPVTAY